MMYTVSLPGHTGTDTKPLNLIQINNIKNPITIKLSFSQGNNIFRTYHNRRQIQK